MNEILQHLKTHGESLDSEIAAAAGLSLAETHMHLAELTAKGEIMAYHSTRVEYGQRTEGIRCRLVGVHSTRSTWSKIEGFVSQTTYSPQ